MLTLYIVRHGESEGNVFRICQGQREMLLTQNGLRQCEALTERFRGVPLDAVYTSDLYRAAETAFSLAKKAQHSAGKVPVYPEPRLREVALGRAEGQPWAQIDRNCPRFFERLQQGEPFPGCETHREAAERAMAALADILSRHPEGSVALVSHGGCIDAILRSILPDAEERCKEVVKNTSVTTLRRENGAWTLVEYNSVSHLAAAGLPDYRMFDPHRTELWFREADLEADRETILTMIRDAWQVVFGSLRDYRELSFYANLRRLAAVPRCVNIGMDGDFPAALLFLDAFREDVPGGGHISQLYLAPEYRRRGIGAQLLGYAATVYTDMGRTSLRLHAARRNKPALRFYHKHGFTQVGLPSLSGQLTLKKSIEVPLYFPEYAGYRTKPLG